MRTLHWFRNDLRLQDNPALLAACQQGEVLPVFILDTDEPVRSVLGGASRAWLHQSLTALDASLNNNLVICLQTDSVDSLPHVLRSLELVVHR